MIIPTIGRVVWFQPEKLPTEPLRDQPFAAFVVYVWSDRMVNLAYFDENGIPGNARSVTLLQEHDPIIAVSALGRFAQWMPYQINQSKK